MSSEDCFSEIDFTISNFHLTEVAPEEKICFASPTLSFSSFPELNEDLIKLDFHAKEIETNFGDQKFEYLYSKTTKPKITSFLHEIKGSFHFPPRK